MNPIPIILLASIISATTFMIIPSSDSPTKTVRGVEIEYELIENTHYCFIDCHLRFRFKLNRTVSVDKISDFKGKFVKAIGASDLEEWGFRIGRNVSYNESRWISDIICNPYSEATPNGTVEYTNCTDNGYQNITEKIKMVYRDFNPFGKRIQADKWYYIELWGEKQPYGGSVDAVPSLLGFDLPFAWWLDYTEQRPILAQCPACSGNVTMPFLVNDTAFYLGDTPQYAWVNHTVATTTHVAADLFYKSGDETNYTFTDAADTAEICFDVDEGNMTDGCNPWEFDAVGVWHQNGTDGFDSSTYGHHLTAVGDPTSTTGQIGHAVDYDSSDYQTVAHSPHLNPNTELTLMAWIKKPDFTNANPGIMAKRAGGDLTYIYYFPGTGITTTELVWENSIGTVGQITSTTSVTANVWTHIAVTHNSTHVTFFTNGTAETPVATAVALTNTLSPPFYIAQEGDGNELVGILDEVRVYNRSLSADEIRAIYDNTVGPHNLSYLGAEETLVVANTSLLGASFNISDFSFSSIDYVTGFDGNFSTGDVEIFLLSSMNIEKVSGVGTNIITIRIRIDGSTVVEEDLRTVTGTGDSGSVGIRPTHFDIGAGNHNITYEFKRSGLGVITINNIDSVVFQTISNASNSVRENITNVSYTHSALSFVPAFNFTINKSLESRTYYTIKQTVQKETASPSTLSYYFEDFDFNHTTPFWQRVLTSASDIGSVSGVYVDTPEVGLLNYTIQSRQTDAGDTVSVNGSILDLDLIDSASNLISGFQTSNPLTNLTNNISLGAGTHNLANFTIRLDDGDSYFLSMSTSFSSTSGSQTPTYLINSTNSTVPCNSSKSRFLSDNDDIGNAFIYMICPSLTAGNDYAFGLWVTVQSGETITQIDESFNGFEITSFDISIINTAPVVAIIGPDDGEAVSGNVTINWTTTDFQGDSYLTNITLTNATATINISVNLPQQTSNITWDSTGVSNGRYNLTVISFENATADNLAGNNTIEIVVNNVPIIIPTVCRVEPVLITNQDNEEIEIGWAFDCDSNTMDGNLFVSGNITAENVFIPQYIFSHTNETIALAGANTWTNVTFIQEASALKRGISHTHNDDTNHTFTVTESGIYDIEFDFDVIDTSGSSTDIDIAGRVILTNGTEIDGSVFETDITKKNIETELSHEFLAHLNSGDSIVFQFTADDADVQISTHGTFGTHPESATIVLEKIANLP